MLFTCFSVSIVCLFQTDSLARVRLVSTSDTRATSSAQIQAICDSALNVIDEQRRIVHEQHTRVVDPEPEPVAPTDRRRRGRGRRRHDAAADVAGPSFVVFPPDVAGPSSVMGPPDVAGPSAPSVPEYFLPYGGETQEPVEGVTQEQTVVDEHVLQRQQDPREGLPRHYRRRQPPRNRRPPSCGTH